MNNRGKMHISSKGMISFLIFLVYWAIALLAGYHTYQVFALADPPFFALLGAVAVDGMLGLTLMLIGRWYNDQRVVGLVGIVLFACLSGAMQVIARKLALGEVMPPALQFMADFAVPISVTLSLLVLGAIQFFDSDSNGVPDFMEQGKNKNQNHNQGQNQSRPRNEQWQEAMRNLEPQHNNPKNVSIANPDRIPESADRNLFRPLGLAQPNNNGNGRKFGTEHGPVPHLKGGQGEEPEELP